MHSDHYIDTPKQRYISLTTYRRDGSEVSTPVWLVGLEGILYFGTDRTRGKFKRLRRDDRVLFAPCDSRGRKILGEWHEGKARLLEERELPLKEEVEQAFQKKYGWRYPLAMFVYRLLGLHDKRVLYEVKEIVD